MPANMLTMDVFKQDAFSSQNMTAAIDKEGFVPQQLGQIPGLFVPPPLGQPRSKAIFVEDRLNQPSLIQTSPRGSYPDSGKLDETTRKVRPFMIPRLYRKRRIEATEIAGIRAYGSVTEMQSLETLVQRVQKITANDVSLTWENMRLGAIQGKVLDADGTTVIYDYTAEFSQSLPAEVTWTLGTADDGSIRSQCTAARRLVVRALKGLGGQNVKVYGLASDSWWDAFTQSTEVRKTFQAAEALRLQNDVTWLEFTYGGVTFLNYRGTDDNSTVAVPDKKVKFFPAGAGIFQEVFAPADERFEFVDTPGQDMYSWVITDPLRNAWADVEVVSCPLYMCTMPSALARGKIT